MKLRKKLETSTNETKIEKLLKKFKDKLKAKDRNYISKSRLKRKVKTAQSFFNIDTIIDNGILKLKSNEYAKVISVEALDLSLTSTAQRHSFFNQLKYLYQIKNLDLRIYKLDDQINLNGNKDYYNSLIEKFKDDESKMNFLIDRYEKIKKLERDDLTTTSKYYFVLIAKEKNILEKIMNDVEQICFSINPKLQLSYINNKIELYQFLINLYLSDANIDQLLWCDLIELIAPMSITENMGYLKMDDKEVQVVAIKGLSMFMDDLFFEEIFNVPGTRCCIHIKDSVNQEKTINNLDNNFETMQSERFTTRKISEATDMDIEKEAIKELMVQIKAGDEKIKEIQLLIVITGTKKEREEKLKELRQIANQAKIKLDVPRMREYEAWQGFDISSRMFNDYQQYMPTSSIAACFPMTVTSFNDETGYIWGNDTHTELPIIFDIFNKNSQRPASNLAIIASTGGGKSFTLKKLIVNELYRGNRVFIFDAEGEYKNLVLKNKGQYIDLYSASMGMINPLQVRYLPSDREELEESLSIKSSEDCPLPKHLGSLETFFKCAFEDIVENEIVVLMGMVSCLYKKYGITDNTPISVLENFQNTDYPTFTDLINYLPEYREQVRNREIIKVIDKLELLLGRFNEGIDKMLFNGHTSIDLNADLIAFNIRDLLNSKNYRVITTQLMNLLTYLNNIIVGNKIIGDKNNQDIKRLAIIIDEFHLYLKGVNNEVILTFEQIARRIRKYHGSFIPTTQSIRDFLGDSEAIRSATAIFNNCQYQLVGMMQEDDLATYLKLFYQNPLTDTQQDFLSKAEMGNFLLTVSRKKRLRLRVIATPLEFELMDEEMKHI